MTLRPRHAGGWSNIDHHCQLCTMNKRTDWYIETRDWVIAEKINGGPFAVYKTHTDQLTGNEWDSMERVVDLVFDQYDITVMMNIVKDHFHAHILTDCDPKLERY